MKKQTYVNAIKSIRTKLEWNGNLISDMETQHIQNTVVMLKNKEDSFIKAGVGKLIIEELSSEEWIEIFKDELKFREVI